MLQVTQIGPLWWMATSEGEEGHKRLTWFGYTEGEVKGKAAAYLRLLQVEGWR
jgi:hypothetical protein